MKHVIVGGSAAGTAAAREIRRHDPDGSITMLSRDPGFFSRCQLHPIASRQRSVPQADFLPENWADTLAVQVRHGVSAARVDTARKIVHTDAGEEIPYGRLLVATGSRTAMPPIEGLEGSGTLGFRDLEDVQALRAALPDAGRVASSEQGWSDACSRRNWPEWASRSRSWNSQLTRSRCSSKRKPVPCANNC